MNSSAKNVLVAGSVVLGLAYLGLCVQVSGENSRKAAARDAAQAVLQKKRDTRRAKIERERAARRAVADKRAAIGRAALTARATKELRAYIAGFGPPSETSWFPYITDARADGDTAVINTFMISGASRRESFRKLCFAASSFIYAPGHADLGLSQILIYDGNGKLAVDRNKREDICAVYG